MRMFLVSVFFQYFLAMDVLGSSIFYCGVSTRNIFCPDEKSWKAEAEIDMELFHQVKSDCVCFIFWTQWLMLFANELSK